MPLAARICALGRREIGERSLDDVDGAGGAGGAGDGGSD